MISAILPSKPSRGEGARWPGDSEGAGAADVGGGGGPSSLEGAGAADVGGGGGPSSRFVCHPRSKSREIVIFWTSAVPSSNSCARASRYTRSIGVGEK